MIGFEEKRLLYIRVPALALSWYSTNICWLILQVLYFDAQAKYRKYVLQKIKIDLRIICTTKIIALPYLVCGQFLRIFYIHYWYSCLFTTKPGSTSIPDTYSWRWECYEPQWVLDEVTESVLPLYSLFKKRTIQTHNNLKD